MKILKENRSQRLLCNKPCLLISILCLGILSSCVTQRNLEYMRDNKATVIFNEPEFIDYRLQPNDALHIQITSQDDATTNIYAASDMQRSLDPYGAYMNSYPIDNEGYISLPVVGKIPVMDKTTRQVSEMIKDSISNILDEPIVKVRLVNQYVSVLGEVETPGHYNYSQDKFTIFNALSLAGDITLYGNRKEVVLTRNENGKNIKMKIDLTKPDILASQEYYIQPNDIIYVKPLHKRFWGMEEFSFTILFSTITTAIVVYTFIQEH